MSEFNSNDPQDVIAPPPSSAINTRKCPYLDTIHRPCIDFDSEKLCSVTLSNRNIYCCLVCGKFFLGRGKLTPCYTHSVQCGHFVFMNLSSGRTYCIPDDYEVHDTSLQDIQKCLAPTYTMQDIDCLSKNTLLARDIYGVSYLPGFIGINNLHSTDYLNVILHALGHVVPFRNFWLQPKNYESCNKPLVKHFGMVMRKLWSHHNFKSTVSPQELMQELSIESKKKFRIGNRSDCMELLIWLIHTFHSEVNPLQQPPEITKPGNGKRMKINGSNAMTSSITDPFQGCIRVTTLTKRLVDHAGAMVINKPEQSNPSRMSLPEEADELEHEKKEGWTKSVQDINFLYLSLDIPPCPLFRDSHGGMVIPQIPLFQILTKFDGKTWTDVVTKDAHVRKRYKLLKLPHYLILHLVRFTKNNFYLEKNPTIVTFPVKNLEMKEFLKSNVEEDEKEEVEMEIDSKKRMKLSNENGMHSYDVNQFDDWNIMQLKQWIGQHGTIEHRLEMEYPENKVSEVQLRAIARSVYDRLYYNQIHLTKYDLIANICHDSTNSSQSVAVGDINMTVSQGQKSTASSATPLANTTTTGTNGTSDVLNQGVYKIHVHNQSTGQWFEIQDLRVQETVPQLIGISESYILIYEKKHPVVNTASDVQVEDT